MQNENFYVGLDIGTNSVGYAAVDGEYNLLKFHGEPAWGVTVFDEATDCAEYRSFRAARRRIDRRRQRVELVQSLLAEEIAKTDPHFFIRLQESFLYRDDAGEAHTLFCDANYTDKDYHEQYPTIHHLIRELMHSTEPHDVRLVYLACAWLVKHRGNFLKNIDKENIQSVTEFAPVYAELIAFFSDNGYDVPWESLDNPDALGDILRKELNITAKNKALIALLYGGTKPGKACTEDFPFNREAIVKLLAGGTVKVKDLFGGDEAFDDVGSVCLSMDDDKLSALQTELGEDFALIELLRKLYDWSVLSNALEGYDTISEAKVGVYEQHQRDLALLKHIVSTYKPEKFDDVFRSAETVDNYVNYSNHYNQGKKNKKTATAETFCKYIQNVLKGIEPVEADKPAFEDMIRRLELRTFMPKQKTTDNRVIPYQLYWYELKEILKNAEQYLPFLAERDSDGLSVSDKLLSIISFRVPYFVGPLNAHSPHAWIQRRAEGKITPWNFEQVVDLEASEEAFIRKLTNDCTYLPGKKVLPKCSLAYQKFMVLNTINAICINGERLPVSLKQQLFNDLFLKYKKVTRKRIVDYLKENGHIPAHEEDTVSGIDVTVNAACTSAIAFRQLLSSGTLTETDVEAIISRSAYAEDKSRLRSWLRKNYPNLNEADSKYICGLKLADFGRLSGEFLHETLGVVDPTTGEAVSILQALWTTQNNLMELLSDKFTFRQSVDAYVEDYYTENPMTLEEKLNGLYVSNAVKRPIYRTMAILKDINKAFGTPKKIFIEMARGGKPEQKGRRTKSRKDQILDLYDKLRTEDVAHLRAELEAMGETADNRLQGDRLFLYYMQLGKCMYTGQPIDLTRLGSDTYDIDHIYPQAMVKDDSIINNKVLVLSSENGAKSDTYPINSSIRRQMQGFWHNLKEKGLISGEKYKRLVRSTPFSDEEKFGFINRQFTETTQSTKAVATLLREALPETEIVYCKAGLVSDFRQEFDLLKSRRFNDLHHAVDAYLNVVVGNVYHMKFTRRWFSPSSRYSINTRPLFTHEQICGGETVWAGEAMLEKVKKIAVKNTAHFTKYAFFKKGGLFDQQLVSAGEGLTPIKKNLPTEKYGGYNKAAAQFFIPVRYQSGKKNETLIMSVEKLYADKFLSDPDFAKAYALRRTAHILGKSVDTVSFPLGKRPWKVNTMLSLDGFRVCITGISNGGKCLIAQSVTQFSAAPIWNTYLKRLESFVEKVNRNPRYIYSEQFDKISAEQNLALYDLYIDKLENSIYKKRVNAPTATLKNGRERFRCLSIAEQAKALLNIHQVFGRLSSGIDLTLIGGVSKAAATGGFSATVSNWRKNYSDVRLIDVSPSGLWEKQSENLLALL